MIDWKTIKKIDAHIHILPDAVHAANPDSDDPWLQTNLHEYTAMMDSLNILIRHRKFTYCVMLLSCC